MRNILYRSMNLNVAGLPLSATLDINEKSNKMLKEGKKVYKFGLGQTPFPVPDSVVEALRENAYKKDYLPVKGLYELRDAVAKYYKKTQKLNYDADNILIGPGSKELMFILQVVFYGELILPAPSWVSYAPQAQIAGRKAVWIDTKKENDWLLMPEDLDRYCRKELNIPRVMILNYPNNPTGKTYPPEHLKEIAEVAGKYGIIILSDEIYGELNHKGEHVSIAKYYPEGTIISSGLSKWCGAGGWRLGTFVFPENLKWLLEGMAAVASETFTAVSAPIQFASIKAFEMGDDIELYLNNSRKILRALGGYIYKKFNSSNISVPVPDGGFYFLPDFTNLKDKLIKNGITTSDKMCEKVLEDTGVAFLPGSAFGRDKKEFTARIAYVDFDGHKALEALKDYPLDKDIDIDFLKNYCGNSITAADKICGWADSI